MGPFDSPIRVDRCSEETTPDGVIRPIRDVWEFWYFSDRHTLVVDKFSRQYRESKRHKLWKLVENYERLSHRRGWGVGVLDAPPDIPRDVALEAHDALVKLASAVKVVRFMGD